MIKELDTVVLTRDVENGFLKKGDIGAVVHCYADGKTFEVEFVAGDGKTVAVITLSEPDLRLMGQKEILHVRALMSA